MSAPLKIGFWFARALEKSPLAQDLRALMELLPKSEWTVVNLHQDKLEADAVDLVHVLRERHHPLPSFCADIPCVESVAPGPEDMFYDEDADWSVFTSTEDRQKWFEHGGPLDQSSLSLGLHAPAHLPAAKRDEWIKRYYAPPAFLERWLLVYQEFLHRPIPLSQNIQPYLVSPFGFLYAGDHETVGTLGTRMATGRIHEEPEVDLVRFFLPHVRTFIDIGANTGYYGFIAVQEGAAGLRSVMVEPQPDCVETMTQTVWLNNWESAVRIWPIGLSNKPGRLTLHLAQTGSTFDNSFNDNAPLPTLDVDVDTLDHRLKQEGIDRADFIKIDVEGFEQSVLEGAVETLRKNKPVLFIEIADHLAGRAYRNPHYQKTLEWLASQGYQVWRLTQDRRLEEALPITPQENVAMYLALHREAHRTWITEVPVWLTERRRLHALEKRRRALHLLRRAFRHPIDAWKAWKRYRQHPETGLRF